MQKKFWEKIEIFRPELTVRAERLVKLERKRKGEHVWKWVFHADKVDGRMDGRTDGRTKFLPVYLWI